MISQSKIRARMQIQCQNTQMHKVRPSSVSHRDEQESIAIIVINSKTLFDLSFLRSHEQQG